MVYGGISPDRGICIINRRERPYQEPRLVFLHHTMRLAFDVQMESFRLLSNTISKKTFYIFFLLSVWFVDADIGSVIDVLLEAASQIDFVKDNAPFLLVLLLRMRSHAPAEARMTRQFEDHVSSSWHASSVRRRSTLTHSLVTCIPELHVSYCGTYAAWKSWAKPAPI
jgi:hypothetical protein